jgi:mannose-1-phosphate guanylyltransferase/mannose-1-phosphate guanylyltransferase/phosphomannomutase
MIYTFRREIFDYFPDPPYVDWAKDIFPMLLDGDVPFYTHVVDRYWNDVGSLGELLAGNLDCLRGTVDVEPAGEIVAAESDPDSPDEGGLDGSVLIGEDVEVGAGVRLDGPVVIGDGVRVGDGARIKESLLLPDAEVPAESLVAASVVGRRGALAAA